MKENFQTRVQQDIDKVIEALLDVGFEYVDNNYLEYEDEDMPIYVHLYPEFLTYSTGGKGKPIETLLEVWIACEIEDDEIDTAGNIVKELLKKSYLKPFKDEDAIKGIFARKGEYKIAFYMNPDYPQGYWQNHVL